MDRGLQNKLAGQTGEFLVCAELGRRGLIATSFTGNVPEFDLIVADNALNTIPIQVKTTRGNNFPTKANLWIDIDIDETNKRQIDQGDRVIDHPDLIYVCVAMVEPDSESKDRFFILRKQDLQVICAGNYREWISKHNWQRPRNFRSLDNRYSLDNLIPFEDRWDLIDDQLSTLVPTEGR